MSRSKRRLPEGLAALRERNYVLYLIGQLTTQAGNWIEMAAVSWIIYEMTNDAIALSLNALCRVLPTVGLAVFGGTIADRLPRRQLLYATESIMLIVALVMGLLAATGQLQYWHLFALNLVSGALTAFAVPARHALFGGLVPRSALQSAVTLNSITVRSGILIGPTIAGFALAFGGYAMPFFFNAISFCVMLAALWAMELPDDGDQRASRKEGVSQQMSDGIKFVWNSPPLRLALCFEIASGVFGYNTALITIIAKDVLGSDAMGQGLLLSAFGAGGLVAMLAMVSIRIRNFERVMLVVGALYALLWAAVGLSQSLWLSALCLFVLGTADSVWGVTRNTLAQTLVSDDMRGRVMSIVMMATRGSSQLGRVQSGFLVWLVGPPAAVLLGSAIISVAVASFWTQGQNRKRRDEEEPSLFPWSH